MNSELKCPFCEKEVDEFHPSSHVIPEWLFKRTYGKQGKYLNINLLKEEVKIAQSGTKKSFVCRNCEGDFAEDDRYASLVLNAKNPRSTVPNVADAKETWNHEERGYRKCLVLEGVNFKKFLKFVLGVVMRGHMAKTDNGKEFLGEKHFRKMKNVYRDDLLLNDSIYPIFILKVDSKDIFSEFIHLPGRGEGPGGANLASFVAGGYRFNVVVQSHQIPEPYLRLRLKSNGELPIPVVGVLNLPGAKRTLKQAIELGRKRIPQTK